MSNNQEKLNALIEELTTLGEDRESLSLWIDLFGTLDEPQRGALLENLEKERGELLKIPAK